MQGRRATSSESSLRRLQSQATDDGFYPVPNGYHGIPGMPAQRQKLVKLNGGAIIRALLAKGAQAARKATYGIYLFAHPQEEVDQDAAFKVAFRFQETPFALLDVPRPGAQFACTASSTLLASDGILFQPERLNGVDVVAVDVGSNGNFEEEKKKYSVLELDSILPTAPEWRLSVSRQVEMAVLRFRVHHVYSDTSLYKGKELQGAALPVNPAPAGSLLDLPVVVLRGGSVVEVPPSLPATAWSNVELTVQDAMRLWLNEPVAGPQKVRFPARRSWIIAATKLMEWEGEQSVQVKLRWTGPALLSVSPHESPPEWSFLIPTVEPMKRESFGFTPSPTADNLGTLGQAVHLHDRMERDARRRSQDALKSYSYLPRGGGPLLTGRLFSYEETKPGMAGVMKAKMEWQLRRAYRGSSQCSVLLRFSALVDHEPESAAKPGHKRSPRSTPRNNEELFDFDFFHRALQARAEFREEGFWPVPDATTVVATGLTNAVRHTYGTFLARLYEVAGLPPPTRTHGREWRQMEDSITNVGDRTASRQFRLRITDPRLTVSEAALPVPGGVLHFGGGDSELDGDGLDVTSLIFQLNAGTTFKAVCISASSTSARPSALPARAALKSVVPALPTWSPSLAAQVKMVTLVFSLKDHWKSTTSKTKFVPIPEEVEVEIHIPALILKHNAFSLQPTPHPDHLRARMMHAASQLMKRLLTPTTAALEDEEAEGKSYRRVMPWVGHFVQESDGSWRIQIAWETISLLILPTVSTSDWSLPLSYAHNGRYLPMLLAGTSHFDVLRLEDGDIGSLGWLNVLVPDKERRIDSGVLKSRGTVLARVARVARVVRSSGKGSKHADMHWVFQTANRRSLNLQVVVPVLFDPAATPMPPAPGGDDRLLTAPPVADEQKRDDRYKIC